MKPARLTCPYLHSPSSCSSFSDGDMGIIRAGVNVRLPFGTVAADGSRGRLRVAVLTRKSTPCGEDEHRMDHPNGHLGRPSWWQLYMNRCVTLFFAAIGLRAACLVLADKMNESVSVFLVFSYSSDPNLMLRYRYVIEYRHRSDQLCLKKPVSSSSRRLAGKGS